MERPRSQMRRQYSAPSTNDAHVRDDTSVSTPSYIVRGYSQHQPAVERSPYQSSRMQQPNIQQLYLPMPTGYEYSGLPAPVQVYWGPTHQSPSWAGQHAHVQSRPQYGPLAQTAIGGHARLHPMQIHQPTYIATPHGRPPWVQQNLHQHQHQHQHQQISHFQHQSPAQYAFMPPQMQQQPNIYQSSSRTKSLIPGNGERSSSSSSLSNINASNRHRSVGSVRSLSSEQRPLASAARRLDTKQPEPGSEEYQSDVVPTTMAKETQPLHTMSTSEPPRTAAPIQPPCAHFLRSGRCGFGDRCKFAHAVPQTEYSSLGLPLREGQQECQFYRKHLRCGFGASCKYHHPEPPAGTVAPNTMQWPSGAIPGSLGGDSRSLEGYMHASPHLYSGRGPLPLQMGPLPPSYSTHVNNPIPFYSRPHQPHPPPSAPPPSSPARSHHAPSGGQLPTSSGLSHEASPHVPSQNLAVGFGEGSSQHPPLASQQGTANRRSRFGNVHSGTVAHGPGRAVRPAGRGRTKLLFGDWNQGPRPAGRLSPEAAEAPTVTQHSKRSSTRFRSGNEPSGTAIISVSTGNQTLPAPSADKPGPSFPVKPSTSAAAAFADFPLPPKGRQADESPEAEASDADLDVSAQAAATKTASNDDTTPVVGGQIDSRDVTCTVQTSAPASVLPTAEVESDTVPGSLELDLRKKVSPSEQPTLASPSPKVEQGLGQKQPAVIQQFAAVRIESSEDEGSYKSC